MVLNPDHGEPRVSELKVLQLKLMHLRQARRYDWVLDLLCSKRTCTQRTRSQGCTIKEDAEGFIRPRLPQPTDPPGGESSKGYIHPSCCKLIVSFQIFVMCLIRSPSKSITYT